MSAQPSEVAPVARVENPFGNQPIANVPTGASAQALVHREVAEVQAAMAMAKRFPRDARQAMDRIITECTRVSLAEKAEYQFARGGQDISGPSIRLAEVIGRGWGNMTSGVTELSRANGMSECLAYAWDLETNFRDEKRFQVRHWRDKRGGGHALTDERDIYELIANQGARRKRACILAIVPGDVTEAAMHQCDTTLKTQIELTPERIKSMVEKFAAEFGVTQEQIEKRIQRRIDAITPALFVNLGKVFNSLKDGMSQVGDWFEVAAAATPASDEPPPATRTEGVKGKLRAKKAADEPQAEGAAAAVGFDVKKAEGELRAATTLQALNNTWIRVQAFYTDGAEIPLELSAAYSEKKEALTP